jgi:hypothetical protein
MKSYERVLRRVCQGFLSPDEIRGVMNGQDVLLDSEEIRERLAKMKAPEPATAVAPPPVRKAGKRKVLGGAAPAGEPGAGSILG